MQKANIVPPADKGTMITGSNIGSLLETLTPQPTVQEDDNQAQVQNSGNVQITGKNLTDLISSFGESPNLREEQEDAGILPTEADQPEVSDQSPTKIETNPPTSFSQAPFGDTYCIDATKEHTATVVILHGVGECGLDMMLHFEESHVPESLPYVRFIFPTAPKRAVRVRVVDGDGKEVIADTKVSSWFETDSQGMIPKHNDFKDIDRACLKVIMLLNEKLGEGVEQERVVIAGFGQGGCVAFRTGYVRSGPTVAGISTICSPIIPTPNIFQDLHPVSISHFISSNEKQELCIGETKVPHTKLLIIVGAEDPIVPPQGPKKVLEQALEIRPFLEAEFVEIREMAHTINEETLSVLGKWILQVLPKTFKRRPPTTNQWSGLS